MRKSTGYITDKKAAVVVSSKRFSQWAMAMSLIAVFFFSTLAGAVGAVNYSNNKPTAASADFDIGKWFMCRWGEESYSKLFYQMMQSDDVEFVLFSKSAISSGGNDVVMGPMGLNWMLDVTGSSFREVNEEVLGRSLVEELGKKGSPSNVATPNIPDAPGATPTPTPTPTRPPGAAEPTEKDEPKKYNSGPRVNPFDRFGVAGLSYTSYMGEWNYVVIDACGEEPKVNDADAGKFYAGRLTPQSTWDDRENSQDVRSLQHNKGIANHFIVSLFNLIANIIFFFPKFVVVVATALVGFAFSDIVSLVGMNEFMAGTGPNDGLFGYFYHGMFVPFTILAFIVVGITFLIQALRGAFRGAISSLVRSIVLFFLAIIISFNPAFWVSLPNAAALMLQGLVISSLNVSIAGGGGLCATDVGKLSQINFGGEGGGTAETMEAVSKDIRSTIGCAFWQEFLFRPWSQAQFGVEWNQTWAKGKAPDWAIESTKSSFNNDDRNAKMVGDADVPLGNSELIHNWALFHLSTQTNVHAPISANGKPGKYTSGLANDWWRVVDAVSNYAELEESVKVRGAGGGVGSPGTGNTGETLGKEVPEELKQYGNGKIPDSVMTALDWAPNHKVWTPVAGNFNALNKAFKEKFGTNISVTDSYRDYAGQVDVKRRKPTLAATPGTSKHGWGIALDLGGGINSFGTPQYNWMKENSQQFGIHHPAWAEPGGSKPEAWHWEFNGTPAGFEDAAGLPAGEVSMSHPDPSAQPLPEWNSWVGNSPMSRIATSMSAAIVAVIGTLPTLFFALLSTMYAFGVALLTAFLPLFLLVGIVGNKGWEIFKGYAELLLNTILRRVAVGLILVLSLMFTSVAIRIMENESWWEGAVLMVLLAYVLFTARGRIIDTVASVRFASFNMSSNAEKIGNTAIGTVKGAVRGTVSSTVSGVSSRRAGGSFFAGTIKGAKHELRGASYQSKTLRHAFHTAESMKANNPADPSWIANMHCMSCSEPLNEKDKAYYNDGEYLCEDCASGHANFNNMETIDITTWDETEDHDRKTKTRVVDTTYIRRDLTKHVEDIKDTTISEKERIEIFQEIGTITGKEIVEGMDTRRTFKNVDFPKAPEQIQPYIDDTLLRRAWMQGKSDYINMVYAQAWTTWFYEAVEADFTAPAEDLAETLIERASAEYEAPGS